MITFLCRLEYSGLVGFLSFVFLFSTLSILCYSLLSCTITFNVFLLFFNFWHFISFIFISWKLIILQYCSGFCHFNYNVFWNGSLNCLFLWHIFTSFQPLTHVWLFVAPILQHQASLSITSSQNLLKLMSTKLVMPLNHLILYHPLALPSIFPESGSVQVSQFFTSGGQIIGFQLQHQSFQWTFSTDLF